MTESGLRYRYCGLVSRFTFPGNAKSRWTLVEIKMNFPHPHSWVLEFYLQSPLRTVAGDRLLWARELSRLSGPSHLPAAVARALAWPPWSGTCGPCSWSKTWRMGGRPTPGEHGGGHLGGSARHTAAPRTRREGRTVIVECWPQISFKYGDVC